MVFNKGAVIILDPELHEGWGLNLVWVDVVSREGKEEVGGETRRNEAKEKY